MAQLPAAGLARRIADAIRDQIHSGVYKAGDRLPSSRALAVEWGASRSTVKAVYGQLIAEGYLATRPGASTTVAYRLDQAASPSVQAVTGAPRRVSSFTQRLRAFPWLVMPTNVSVADFRYGDLSAADFPVLAWRRAMNRAMVRRRVSLRYDNPLGYAPLRTALQGYLWRARGIRCSPEQIAIVNGSQQGLDICARLLLDPGDRFIMENPGYGLARLAFEAAGGISIPIPVDDEGLQTASLPPARFAYVTPSHQFPQGGVLSATRRRTLLAWAAQNDAYIVEDDYDGEYRHGVAPIAPLQTIDPDAVIYIGTLSKTLSPTLRLGYLVAPTALCSDFAGAKRIMDRHSSLYEQEALAELLETGVYERHVRSIRRKNAHRRGVLLTALIDTLGDSIDIAGADTGLHVVVWIKGVPADREADIVAAAQARGIGLYKVSPHFDRSAPPPALAGVVLGYAALESVDATLNRKGIPKIREL